LARLIIEAGFLFTHPASASACPSASPCDPI
jgi:hypothetical protein